jgi:hypothetical protein
VVFNLGPALATRNLLGDQELLFIYLLGFVTMHMYNNNTDEMHVVADKNIYRKRYMHVVHINSRLL